VSVPGFPNMYSMLAYGYNGTSYFQLIENQMRQVLRCLRLARSEHARGWRCAPRRTIATSPRCLTGADGRSCSATNCSGANRYYFDRNGDAPLPAATSLKADRQSGHFNVNDYAYDRSVSVINSRNWLP
jgi:hypothetical protein